jgi:hypothetical protein
MLLVVPDTFKKDPSLIFYIHPTSKELGFLLKRLVREKTIDEEKHLYLLLFRFSHLNNYLYI